MSHTEILRPFLGTSADWPAYLISIVDAAKRSSSVEPHGYGLIPYLFADPNDIFLASLPGFTVPHEPLQAPALKPVLADNPTAAQLNQYTALFNTWKYDNDSITQLRTDIAKFLSLYLGSLPEVTLISIRDPIHGTSLLTLATVTTAIRQLYGTLSPADLSANEATLTRPYSTLTTVREYTASHLTSHAIAASNGMPFSEHQKVKFLEKGLAPSGLYNNQLLIWLSTHTLVVNQTFAALSTALHGWSDTLGHTTIGSLGYSAAAFDAAVAAAVNAIQQPIARNRATNNGLANRPIAITTRPLTYGPPQYCWTHGSGHSGKHCRNPNAGHIKEATFASKMGGHT